MPVLRICATTISVFHGLVVFDSVGPARSRCSVASRSVAVIRMQTLCASSVRLVQVAAMATFGGQRCSDCVVARDSCPSGIDDHGSSRCISPLNASAPIVTWRAYAGATSGGVCCWPGRTHVQTERTWIVLSIVQHLSSIGFTRVHRQHKEGLAWLIKAQLKSSAYQYTCR